MVAMGSVHTQADVLSFWFRKGRSESWESLRDFYGWCMRGGADEAIAERFGPTLDAAIAGALDDWATTAKGRLALILVLDQFSRTIFKGTPRMYAQDAKAVGLSLEGLENGHYAELDDPDEKTFCLLPLGHSEDVALHERAQGLVREILESAPDALRRIYTFSVSQAEGSRDVIRRFGRYPHRNALLGRESSPEELEYLASETPVHQRPTPK